jgi:hypothetical protein
MKCNRLMGLIKNWYIQVQNEAMAPARMVEFMTNHIAHCEVCNEDSDVREEAKKIREIVLPPSKVPKPAEPEEDDSEEHTAEDTESNIYPDDQDEDTDPDESDMVDAD